MGKNNDEVRLASAVARKYVASCGNSLEGEVGVEVYVAALAKVLSSAQAFLILTQAGMTDAEGFLEQIPAATVDEVESYPALKPNEELSHLLKGGLKPFRDGEMGAAETLRLIVSGTLLEQATRQKLGLVPRSTDHQLFDTRTLTRELARIYKTRYMLGAEYHGGQSKSGHTDFVSGKHDQAFCKTYRQQIKEETETWTKHFGSRCYSASPLGRIRDSYGEIAAHVAGAVLLAEMGYVGSPPLTMREVGYIIDPKYYFRILRKVRSGIKQLVANGQMRVSYYLEDSIPLSCRVHPSDELLDSWLGFLEEKTPIADDEIEEMYDLLV